MVNIFLLIVNIFYHIYSLDALLHSDVLYSKYHIHIVNLFLLPSYHIHIVNLLLLVIAFYYICQTRCSHRWARTRSPISGRAVELWVSRAGHWWIYWWILPKWFCKLSQSVTGRVLPEEEEEEEVACRETPRNVRTQHSLSGCSVHTSCGMCVGVWVCVCVCVYCKLSRLMYVYIYIHTHTHTHTHTRTHTYIHTYIHTPHTCVCVCVYVCLSLCVCVSVCICVCVCIYMYIYIYVYIQNSATTPLDYIHSYI